MNNSQSSRPHLSLRLTKGAAALACLLFLIAVALTPGPGSSLGMRWPLFFCTWGTMMFGCILTILGFLACKTRNEQISVFYLICPLLLILAVVALLFRNDLIHALLRLGNQ